MQLTENGDLGDFTLYVLKLVEWELDQELESATILYLLALENTVSEMNEKISNASSFHAVIFDANNNNFKLPLALIYRFRQSL